MTLNELNDKSMEHNEHNDCGVKAVAVATGVSYEEAHAAMKNAGRKNRRTSWVYDHVKPALHELGFEMVKEKFPGKTLVTLERNLKRYARGRKFFITVRGHFVAFDGEQIVDWAQGRRHHVKDVYRVKRFVSDEKPVENTQRDLTNAEDTPTWLRPLPRPKGAPKIGTRVKLTMIDNATVELTVVKYLSVMFIAMEDSGRERVVHVAEDWEAVS